MVLCHCTVHLLPNLSFNIPTPYPDPSVTITHPHSSLSPFLPESHSHRSKITLCPRTMPAKSLREPSLHRFSLLVSSDFSSWLIYLSTYIYYIPLSSYPVCQVLVTQKPDVSLSSCYLCLTKQNSFPLRNPRESCHPPLAPLPHPSPPSASPAPTPKPTLGALVASPAASRSTPSLSSPQLSRQHPCGSSTTPAAPACSSPPSSKPTRRPKSTRWTIPLT